MPCRPSSRCENLLRETLIKDELQREKEMYDFRGREESREGHHTVKPIRTQPRRASLYRSVTDNAQTLPRATSLSPTRHHHRTHSHQRLPHHAHSHPENPYDQVLRARLEKVLTSACGPGAGCLCHARSCKEKDTVRKGDRERREGEREKRDSLPATPLGGGGGWFGWFWREGEEEEGRAILEHASSVPTSQTHVYFPSTLSPEEGARPSYKRSRSHTAPSSSSRSRSHPSDTLPPPSRSTSAASSPWVIPLETVYSVEGENSNPNNSKGDETMLTPPPTPPDERHRRTQSHPHTSSSYPAHPNSYLATQKARRPRALSAREPSPSPSRTSTSTTDEGGAGAGSGSPMSARSLPLPLPHPQSTPPFAENPRKFNVRTASAQLRRVEGYVSFMAVEGLGEPDPEKEEEDGVVQNKKAAGRRWLLF
ncbi:hypothetical protein V5O48_006355 [Marasmius crinis-equi]|uniref:Uncharacterized protein n=1 Tax=Marasmius crinis-equi TaxID=585013 RepID=A0ABR3FKN3_9AGAR